MMYGGKELSDYDLWELEAINTNLKDAEARREEASKHEKFTTGIVGKQAMEFPPPNPNFLILKSEIGQEIERKKNA